MIYNKLVRDFIPQVIERDNKKCVVRTLDDGEYRTELEKKLQEEVSEYLRSDGDMEEMADILEVMFAILKDRGCNFEDILKIKEKKRSERGGFDQKLFLEKIM